jgi:hypothetical protein
MNWNHDYNCQLGSVPIERSAKYISWLFFFIFSEKAYLFNVIILQKNKRKVKLS